MRPGTVWGWVTWCANVLAMSGWVLWLASGLVSLGRRAAGRRQMAVAFCLVSAVVGALGWRWVHRCGWEPLRQPAEERERQWRELTVLWRALREIGEDCAGSLLRPGDFVSCLGREWAQVAPYLEGRCEYWP